jgi:class 3 adenylate cyclase
MVRADDCHDALRLAARVIALNMCEGYPPIRVGVDVGSAVEHAGDWYGSTVNTAARVTDAAGPGELVVTDRAQAVIAEAADTGLATRGVWQLKGLPTMRLHTRRFDPPVRLHETRGWMERASSLAFLPNVRRGSAAPPRHLYTHPNGALSD